MADLLDSAPTSILYPRLGVVERARAAIASGWSSGKPVRVEDFAKELETAEDWFELILAEIHARWPSSTPPTLTEFLVRFPVHAERIRRHFAEPATAVIGPTNWVPPRAAPNVIVPGYEVLGVLGRGGMGIVYKARHLKLNRVVALKMILFGQHAGSEELVRFGREAEAVAQIRHPNVVQVYEVGEHDGAPYVALEFVPGGTLSERLKKGVLTPTDAAGIAEAIARGAHAAHEHGIVHRDLKPANILLGNEAEGRKADSTLRLWQTGITPKVTDFGIAKRLNESHGLTATGCAAGTPQYMAPEQALAAKDKPVGPASDVYAVGAILFEMLSGQPPFDAENPVEVMRRVISETPPPLTRFVRGLPKDLETICRKCLEKDPLRRYRSAEALADDLNRWLVGKPIAARPIGPIGQVVRWSRRNRVVASLLFGVFLALTGGIVVSVGLAIRANRYAVEAERNANLAKANATTARENAERAEANAVTAKAREAAATASEGRANAARAEEAKLRQEADTRERLRARELYDANMSVAHAAWESGHPNHTRLLLDKYLPSHPDKPDPRGFEWFYLSRLTRFRDYTITAPDRIVCGASIPGTVLHAIGLPNAVHIWDPPACKAVHWKARWPGLRSVAFSPDGHVMATGYQHGRIHLFDRTENRAISEATLRESDEFYVISLVFSPNGKTVYAAIGIDTRVTEPTQVVALDVESGKELRRFKGATGSLRGVSLSPDGATLVAGGYDGKVRMWSTATGDSKESIDTGGLISAIAYSPSGKVLATGTARGVVSVWDVATGQLRNELSGHADWADRLAFSGDGRYLATGSRDGIARVWDVATGVPYRAYRGHDRRIAAVGFSNNGRNLFSASEDSTGVLWDTTRDSECVTQRLPNLYGHAAIPLPDKCRALIVSDHCYLQFLDLDTGALSPARTPKGVLANLLAASLSPDGATVALSTYQQGLMLVAVADLAAQPRRIDVPLTTALAWSGDGQSLIVGHRDGGLASIAVDGKSPPRRFGPSRTRVDVVATSRQLPNRVIASCGDGTIRAFDPVTGDEAFTVEVGSHRPTCLTINPDGSRFATGGFDGSVRVWNSATGKLIQRLDGHTNEVTSVAFDGTGLRLATGSFDLTAKLWDVETGLQVLSLRGHSQTVRGVAFGPEGGTFITVGGGEVRLWDARAGMSYERGRLLAAAVRIEPTSAEWKRATGVTANFRLINGSTKSLQAPTLNTNNATFQVGALVERIGPDPTIPALESKRRPHDQRYAVGALTLSMPPMTLEPNGFVEGKITFPADWPAGKYRLYLEHGWDGKAVENAPLAARDFIVPTRDD